MDLNGAVAVVTGGNGGLGQRICHALAREGVHVAVVYAQSRDQAEGVARELSSRYQAIEVLGRRPISQAGKASAQRPNRPRSVFGAGGVDTGRDGSYGARADHPPDDARSAVQTAASRFSAV